MATATANGNGRAAVVVSDLDKNEFSTGAGLILPQKTLFEVTLVGVSKMLFHRYDCASVEAKGKAGKGTAAKKTDDIESYVYRDAEGNLAIPSENLHATLIASAKSFQDPRSPRKSASDLFKAGVLVLPEMLTLRRANGTAYETWDFLDTRRVKVQMSAVSRTRPGVEAGWTLDAEIHVLQPSLISAELLRSVLMNAGASCGLCDFRPIYGRFQPTKAQEVALL